MSTNPPEKTETIATLMLARDLLARPNGWTQHAYARDARGCDIELMSPRATSFCMLGALRRAGGTQALWWPKRALEEIVGEWGMAVAHFNDSAQSPDDVLAAFDRAIELVREEP